MTARAQKYSQRKHGWNSLEDYLKIHHRVLTNPKYTSHFTNSPAYQEKWHTDQYLELNAVIVFARGIRLEIEKHVDVQDGPRGYPIAKTDSYTYNVSDDTGCLFRYCSAHPTHNTFDHRHTYDQASRVKMKPADRLAPDEVPYVSDVISEVVAFMSDPYWP